MQTKTNAICMFWAVRKGQIGDELYYYKHLLKIIKYTVAAETLLFCAITLLALLVPLSVFTLAVAFAVATFFGVLKYSILNDIKCNDIEDLLEQFDQEFTEYTVDVASKLEEQVAKWNQ
jgi:nitrogen fixation-related uncharacterized protein